MSFNKVFSGDLTNPGGGTALSFRSFSAKSILANAGNNTAVPTELAGSGAFQYLRVNSANTGLEWGVLGLSNFPTIAAGSMLANITANTAVPAAHALSTFAGAGLTYTNVTGIMAVGAGTGITVNANDVAINQAFTPTWTGVHSFTGTSHTIDVTGTVLIDADAASRFVTSVGNLTLQTTAAGSRVVVSGADDVLIEAVADDVFINSGGLMQFTSGTALVVDMATLFRLSTGGVERLEIEATGAWQLGGVVGPAGEVFTSNGSGSPPTWQDPAPFRETSSNRVGDTLVFSGANWVTVNNHFDEEFSGALQGFLAASGNVGKYHWQNVNADDGTFAAIESETAHPGVVRIEGSVSGNTVRITSGGLSGTNGTNYVNQFVLGEVAFVHWIVRIPSTSSLATCNYGIGLVEDCEALDVQGTTPNLGNNGLILHKNTGQTVWNFRRETASAAVLALTARTAVLGDWIEVYGINLGGGDWIFNINGVDNASGLSGVSTTALVRPVFFCHQTANGVRQFDVDKFEVGLKFAANRYTT